MPKYDDRTPRGWPLPNKENLLSDDVERIRETFSAIDTALTEIENSKDEVDYSQIEALGDSISEINENLAEHGTAIMGIEKSIESINEKVAKGLDSTIAKGLGLYIDADGDLAQDEKRIDTDPEIIEIPSELIASDDEVDAMLDDVFGS